MGGISGIQFKMKLRPTPLAPMTANGYVPDIKDVVAVVFQNTGTNNAAIFNGMYTILANGGTLALNVTEDFASMDVLQLDVVFTGAGTNRLEILTLRPSGEHTFLNC